MFINVSATLLDGVKQSVEMDSVYPQLTLFHIIRMRFHQHSTLENRRKQHSELTFKHVKIIPIPW